MEMKNLFVKLMATLWENTYRAVVTDQNDQYVATARVIVNIPLSREVLPDNAPEVTHSYWYLLKTALSIPIISSNSKLF